MSDWSGAFQSESEDKDELAAAVDRIIAQVRPPESVLARLSRLTRTPPNLNSYRFALYFAFAMGNTRKPQEIRILDIGSFAGLFVRVLMDRGFRAEGIEIDLDHIEIAGDLGTRLVHGDAFRLGEYFEPGIYDLVTCIRLIESKGFDANEEKILKLCGECRGALAPGGFFLINSPEEISFPRRKVLDMGFVSCEREEQYCFGVLNLQRHLILKKTGGE